VDWLIEEIATLVMGNFSLYIISWPAVDKVCAEARIEMLEEIIAYAGLKLKPK
jgi:hypothetical protein